MIFNQPRRFRVRYFTVGTSANGVTERALKNYL